jgi:hypothetical protein
MKSIAPPPHLHWLDWQRFTFGGLVSPFAFN